MIKTQANWSQLREQFPALRQCTYLDTASFGQLPQLASQAMVQHLTHRDQTASTRFLTWFDDMDLIRSKVAQLIHCESSDIAFIPSASTGLSYLMQGLAWKSGDEVLTLDNEFPNQLYQGAAVQKFGVTFRAVPWAEFYQSVTVHTRLVLLSTVNYAMGFAPPLEEISAFLRARGILFYVDGTQSIGALQFDVQKIRPSMLAVDAYKWMMCPNGAGFVYIEKELRDQLTPTVIGWRSDAGWRQVGSLNHGMPVFDHDAATFEGGMIAFPSLYAMGAVLDLLLETEMSEIESRVLDLAGNTRAMLAGLGAEVNSDHSQIVTAKFPGRDAAQLATSLKAENIFISARHGRLRISSHFYNNESDIQTLRDALRS